MGDLVVLRPALDPDVVLDMAKGEYKDCIILGYDDEGCLDVRASLGLNKPQILLLVEQFTFKLVLGDYDIG